MGMSASQARYLGLTARKSNIEFQGQQINEQRAMLAKQMEQIATKYTKKMNNRELLFVQMDANGNKANTTQLSYDIITSTDPFNGLNMRVVDKDGKIVVPFAESYENKLKRAEEEYQSAINKNCFQQVNQDGSKMLYTGKNFISTYMSEASKAIIKDKDNVIIDNDELKEKIQGMTATDFYEFWQKSEYSYQGEVNFPQAARYEGSDSYAKMQYEQRLAEIEAEKDNEYVFDLNCVDPKYLEERLRNADWYLEKRSADTADMGKWTTTSWQSNISISDMADKSDDTQAEAEYTTESQSIQSKDKMLELTLKQLDSEHSAIQTEMDSVKKVIEKNIEGTFKTFG